MFHEQAARVGSFGMHYYPTALSLSFESAMNRETEEWIIELLNLLQGRNPVTDIVWTTEEILNRARATSGNPVHLLLPP